MNNTKVEIHRRKMDSMLRQLRDDIAKTGVDTKFPFSIRSTIHRGNDVALHDSVSAIASSIGVNTTYALRMKGKGYARGLSRRIGAALKILNSEEIVGTTIKLVRAKESYQTREDKSGYKCLFYFANVMPELMEVPDSKVDTETQTQLFGEVLRVKVEKPLPTDDLSSKAVIISEGSNELAGDLAEFIQEYVNSRTKALQEENDSLKVRLSNILKAAKGEHD